MGQRSAYRPRRRFVRRVRTAAVALVCGGVLVACGGGSTDPDPTGTPSAASSGSESSGSAGSTRVARPPSRTQQYLPGLQADVWEPATPAPGPLVVLIPGGGWVSADRAGLAPLASALSDDGMTVVSATYRTSSDDEYFPAPLEDVLCAVAFAAAVPTATGDAPHPVVVVGHSAGANLAALAALVPEGAGESCPYQAVAPDALVGLAGPYDVAQLPEIAVALFGASAEDEPGRWEDGNPVLHAGGREDVPVLLLHGEDDPVVPVFFTTEFAAALEDGGHDTTVEIVPGTDHSGIYQVDVAADRIIDWVDTLP
ncbi:alpha/beta hydrolase [Pengzhenrongella frigida]|uniref:Alpha/beta hydrolase n=1 Tax=Pengzhenrongella frigida TaxID=1259133 RepID=A0A4Q5MZT5_9MICO|nr:alpha/beta hydrolase [Cellulomonas sp. HLT2-17]RYV51255.1 alpha/beta hydrolase [Cellulomonas sp. HLT2-17]